MGQHLQKAKRAHSLSEDDEEKAVCPQLDCTTEQHFSLDLSRTYKCIMNDYYNIIVYIHCQLSLEII